MRDDFFKRLRLEIMHPRLNMMTLERFLKSICKVVKHAILAVDVLKKIDTKLPLSHFKPEIKIEVKLSLADPTYGVGQLFGGPAALEKTVFQDPQASLEHVLKFL